MCYNESLQSTAPAMLTTPRSATPEVSPMRRQPIMIPCVCQGCGRTFLAKDFDVRRGRGHFCAPACYNSYRNRGTPDRFWSHVDTSGDCWVWKGVCTSSGYGVFRTENGQRILAHRFTWEQVNGPIPSDKVVI